MCPGTQDRPCSGHNPPRATVLRSGASPALHGIFTVRFQPLRTQSGRSRAGEGLQCNDEEVTNKVCLESWLSEQGVQLSFILLPLVM